jgi:ribosomal protein L23
MILKPVATEKAVKMIELDNTLIFETEMRAEKPEIRAEIEKLFNVKVVHVGTAVRHNKKLAYVKLNKANPAIDVATKLGMI